VSAETPRAGPPPALPAPELEGQQWAIERRLGEIFGKLGEKLADPTGRVEVAVKPETSFTDIGGLAEAKGIVRSFVTALTDPELYRRWGITPPKGMLIYGPPGTGKTLLARALATEAGAVFYHLKLGTLTAKFGPNTGELLQEILGLAKEQGKGVVFLDQADALALEHLLPPVQAREAGARIVAALCEKLDTMEDFSRIVAVAATSRTDAVDPSLVAPGRLDRLVEVPLPDAAAQQQIVELSRARAEQAAQRQLVADLDYRSLLPPMGGMSGGEIRDLLRRALEEKVHAAGQGQDAGLVTTQDLLRQLDVYRRIRAVVEKIRYGQYL
jgi:ATP-dependent 26S proteasome regulatory subunit